MSNEIESFRTEIREIVTFLAELNKTKIFLITGILAVAFGVVDFGSSAKNVKEFSYIILILVPFICSYIDFQYYHGLAKIFVLAHFLSKYDLNSPEILVIQDYERFVEKIRTEFSPKLFGFEAKAQLGSSLILSIIGPLMGIPIALSSSIKIQIYGISQIYIGISCLILSAAIGAIYVYFQYNNYRSELRKAKQAVPERLFAKKEGLNEINNLCKKDSYQYKSSHIFRLTYSKIESFLNVDDNICLDSSIDLLERTCSNFRNNNLDSEVSVILNQQLSNEKQTTFEVIIKNVDAVYGLGASIRGFNRSNKTTYLVNNDTHFNTQNKSAYTSFPIFLLRGKDCFIGLIWNSSLPAKIENRFNNGAMQISIETLRGGYQGGDFFFIKDSFANVVDFITFLTGRTFIPPLWAFGYHQSRWSYKNEAQIKKIALFARELQIPCDAIYFDIHHLDGYRVFTWDKSRFKNPIKLFEFLKNFGIKGMVITNPGIKVDKKFDVYVTGKSKNYFCQNSKGYLYVGKVWPGKCVFPDFTRQDVRKWWESNINKLIKMGAGGIWNDMNEPVLLLGSKKDPLDEDVQHFTGPHWAVRNKYALYQAKSTYFAIESSTNENPFILTRSGCSGIQQYACVWTGDNQSSWDDLKQNLYDVINLGISGVAICGADIGGFCNSSKVPSFLKSIKLFRDADLFVRWVQLGSLLPFFRIHTSLYSYSQDPWSFGEISLANAKKHICRRYSLIPYLYSLAIEAHESGMPIVRPLFAEFTYLFEVEDQFLLGNNFLVAPVFEPNSKYRKITVPKGCWFDYETGHTYNVEDLQKDFEIKVTEDYYPILVRAGAVIPKTIPKNNALNSVLDSIIFELYLIDTVDCAEGNAFYVTEQRSDLSISNFRLNVKAIKISNDTFQINVSFNNTLHIGWNNIILKLPMSFSLVEHDGNLITQSTSNEVFGHTHDSLVDWQVFIFELSQITCKFRFE
ncbi:MAG: glycoside hydrolase family 31 protein [Methylophilus sp.]|nr:glycoside hydrolase family 31 protein [Methylophilus sp.]